MGRGIGREPALFGDLLEGAVVLVDQEPVRAEVDRLVRVVGLVGVRSEVVEDPELRIWECRLYSNPKVLLSFARVR